MKTFTEWLSDKEQLNETTVAIPGIKDRSGQLTDLGRAVFNYLKGMKVDFVGGRNMRDFEYHASQNGVDIRTNPQESPEAAAAIRNLEGYTRGDVSARRLITKHMEDAYGGTPPEDMGTHPKLGMKYSQPGYVPHPDEQGRWTNDPAHVDRMKGAYPKMAGKWGV